MSPLLSRGAFSLLSSSSRRHHHLSPFPALLRLSLSTKTHQSKEEMPFIANYLISTFDCFPDRALKVSSTPHLMAIKSPDRPNSVVTFLKEVGLSDAQIKKAVLCYPRLLSFKVERSLRPWFHELTAAGFTQEILIPLIYNNPGAICSKDIISRLNFWRGFANNSDVVLLKVIQRCMHLMGFDIDRDVIPRVNLLKEFGLSSRDIVNMLTRGSGCMLRSVESLRQILEQTEKLGFLRGSPMFVHGLHVVSYHKKEILETKMEFFKNRYGWSEEEVSSAIKKFPSILAYSKEKVEVTMEFLIKKVELEARSIASHPTLVGFSLERRLRPRHHVLSLLESKGLKKSLGLLKTMQISEEQFIERFVVPYEKDVPGLGQAYVTAQG